MGTAIVQLAGILVLGSAQLMAVDSEAIEALGSSVEIAVVFTDEEIRIIRAHYASHGGSKGGKSRRKQKRLPPGIAKNLARGKALPPGIAKQVLPYELRRALPKVIDGHERIIVAGKILLIETATQMVRDVLSDVILE